LNRLRRRINLWSGRSSGLHHGLDLFHLLSVLVNVARDGSDKVLDLPDALRVPHPIDPLSPEHDDLSFDRTKVLSRV